MFFFGWSHPPLGRLHLTEEASSSPSERNFLRKVSSSPLRGGVFFSFGIVSLSPLLRRVARFLLMEGGRTERTALFFSRGKPVSAQLAGDKVALSPSWP